MQKGEFEEFIFNNKENDIKEENEFLYENYNQEYIDLLSDDYQDNNNNNNEIYKEKNSQDISEEINISVSEIIEQNDILLESNNNNNNNNKSSERENEQNKNKENEEENSSSVEIKQKESENESESLSSRKAKNFQNGKFLNFNFNFNFLFSEIEKKLENMINKKIEIKNFLQKCLNKIREEYKIFILILFILIIIIILIILMVQFL